METHEFLLAARLESGTLDAWIEAGWLVRRDQEGAGSFSEIDVARVRLIRDLGQLGVNDEAVPIILHLIDQLHGLRRTLRVMVSQSGDAKPLAE